MDGWQVNWIGGEPVLCDGHEMTLPLATAPVDGFERRDDRLPIEPEQTATDDEQTAADDEQTAADDEQTATDEGSGRDLGRITYGGVQNSSSDSGGENSEGVSDGSDSDQVTGDGPESGGDGHMLVEQPDHPFSWLRPVGIGLSIVFIMLAAVVVAYFGRQRLQYEKARKTARRSKARSARGSSKTASQSKRKKDSSLLGSLAKVKGTDVPTPAGRTEAEVIPLHPMPLRDNSVPAAGNSSRPIALTGVGKLHEQGARKQQQDSFGLSDLSLIDGLGVLAVVADGMGGLENGAAVSETAVQSALNQFLLVPQGTDQKALLVSLAAAANKEVNDMLGPQGIRTSGSTLVMAHIQAGNLSFLSIGDSHIYLYRKGMMTLLNREHVYEGELLIRAVNGEMGIGEALTDKEASGLVSFLGMGNIEHMDLSTEPLRLLSGDKVVLTTDGVYNALSEGEMVQALAVPSAEEACEQLGALISGKGFVNQDNYTAIVLGFGG